MGSLGLFTLVPKYRIPPMKYEIHCLKIAIHEIHKMNESHLPEHRNPQHIGLYEIQCLKVEINRTYLWHMMSKC